MFASAVVAVSVLRKKCSKKQKSNNEVIDIKSDFFGGNQEKDTLEYLHKMEQPKMEQPNMSQPIKLERKNRTSRHSFSTDAKKSEKKDPSLKNNHSLDLTI